VLDLVDEVGPKPGDLAIEHDARHSLGDGLQEYSQFERG
jgi:hypothetical protein